METNPPMNDEFHLDRFVRAQNQVYKQVLAELARGHKETHWIWFIFPQLKGLGSSPMAERYGIASQAEAVAYLQHPVLGPRLLESTELVNRVEGKSIDAIFGFPDNLKFRSSMTLFRHVAPEVAAFYDALTRFFQGEADPLTLILLSKHP